MKEFCECSSPLFLVEYCKNLHDFGTENGDENSNEVMNEISAMRMEMKTVSREERICVVKTTYLKKSSKSQNY